MSEEELRELDVVEGLLKGALRRLKRLKESGRTPAPRGEEGKTINARDPRTGNAQNEMGSIHPR